MRSDTRDDLGDQQFVVVQVRTHGQARVHLLKEVARGVMHRVRLVDRHVEHHRRNPELQGLEIPQIRLQLGDEHVHAFGILRRQLVRPAVAGPDNDRPFQSSR